MSYDYQRPHPAPYRGHGETYGFEEEMGYEQAQSGSYDGQQPFASSSTAYSYPEEPHTHQAHHQHDTPAYHQPPYNQQFRQPQYSPLQHPPPSTFRLPRQPWLESTYDDSHRQENHQIYTHLPSSHHRTPSQPNPHPPPLHQSPSRPPYSRAATSQGVPEGSVYLRPSLRSRKSRPSSSHRLPPAASTSRLRFEDPHTTSDQYDPSHPALSSQHPPLHRSYPSPHPPEAGYAPHQPCHFSSAPAQQAPSESTHHTSFPPSSEGLYYQPPPVSTQQHYSPLLPHLPPSAHPNGDFRQTPSFFSTAPPQPQYTPHILSYPYIPDHALEPPPPLPSVDFAPFSSVDNTFPAPCSAPPLHPPTASYSGPVLEAVFAQQDSFVASQKDPYLDEAFFAVLPLPPNSNPSVSAAQYHPSSTPLDYPAPETFDYPHISPPFSDPSPPLSLPPTLDYAIPQSHSHTPYHSPPSQPSSIYPPSRQSPLRPVFDANHDEDETTVIALAAIRRALNKTLDAAPMPYHPPRAKNDGLNGKASASLEQKRARTAKLIEVGSQCWTCGTSLALLRLRGKDLSNLAPRAKATCLSCLPIDMGSSSNSAAAEEETPSYADTLSAAIDALEGLDIETGSKSAVSTPSNGGGLVTAAPEEEVRLPLGMEDRASKCDVCSHLVGICEVTSVPIDPSHAMPPFTVETICARCLSLYKPCSDCGGGGGRLTSGRWRSIELFPDGRKTCQLSHARFPSLDEITYSCQRTADIAPEKMEEYEPILKRLYFNARLAVLARPEFLSKGDGLASSFYQAERTTTDSWNLMSPLLSERLDSTDSTQRYLTLMIAAPRGRRPGSTPQDKKGAEIIGFNICTVDFAARINFFAVAIPWALTGEAFTAMTRLGEVSTGFIQADRRHLLNTTRRAAGLEELPHPVSASFLIVPFKRDSKVSANIERRGYLHLKDYLRQYPDADERAFPPYRQTWVPARFASTMQTFVKPLKDEQDLGGPPAKVTRRGGFAQKQARGRGRGTSLK